MIECSWLPNLIPCENMSDFLSYQNRIYEIFKNDFIVSHPLFSGKPVKIRFHPIEFGKEEAFYHVTCQDYQKDGQRDPDLRRCERIRWVRKFIENYNCDSSACPHCEGIKLWDEPRQSYLRTHILLEPEKYMVVLEKRQEYCLLITAFYFDHEHMLQKALNRYEKYKAKSAS